MKLFEWFKKEKKVYPEFWQNYIASFESKAAVISPQRVVAFDTETTGLNHRKDVILSIGAVGIYGNRIKVNDHLEVFIEQDISKKESIAIHGILKEGKQQKLQEHEAIAEFLNFIQDAVLVGHHVRFDIMMINNALQRMGLPKLKNKSIDTDTMYQKYKRLPEEHHFSLDELCEFFKISRSDRHTAIGDAYITALIYLRLKDK